MKKNSLSMDQFLEMDYKMIIEPYENVEYNEKGYVITCPDLAGIKVFGNTLEEAFEELSEAKIAWFEMKEELNEEVVAPEAKTKPSGRLTLRLPINLHEKVLTFSEENSTSLNSAINSLIIEGLHATEMNSLKVAAIKEIQSQQAKFQKRSKSFSVSDNPYSYDIVEEFKSARTGILKEASVHRRREVLYESELAPH